MKILLVAGGSGGHLIPAMTLAESLRGEGPCWMMSTARPVDKILYDEGLDWVTVDLRIWTPLRRWLSPLFLAHQMGALRRAWTLLRRIRPDVVVGFGGYLSAVGLAFARLQGIPTVIHEQNLMPGRANRWLAPGADATAISFPETARLLSRRAAVELTGNLVRSRLREVSSGQARSHFRFDPDRPVLLVMGGSQGSQAVNQAVLKMWETVPPEDRQRLQVIHLTGARSFDQIVEAYRRLSMEARVFPFLHQMEFALAAATLAVSRAGATAIAEMIALGLPAILIPYPHAGGHQRFNAHWVEVARGATVLEERELTPEKLWAEVSALLGDSKRLARMKEALEQRADGSAAERLKVLVCRIAGRRSVQFSTNGACER